MSSPVLVADDHPLFRSALMGAVKGAAPDRDVVERDTLKGALDALAEGAIGLLTLDVHMPDSDGLAGLLEVRNRFPAVPVIVVSGDTNPKLAARVAGFGATGFIPKATDLPLIKEAIAAVLDGETWLPDEDEPSAEDEALKTLTPAQLRVLLFVRDGLLNKQIAYEMQISEATVKAHMTAVMQKLGVHTRTQAAMMARSLDISSSESSED